MSERANKVSVQAVESGFEARFFRTHKHVGTVGSADTQWVADAKQNRTLQREMFRMWVCEQAEAFGIAWDPADKRDESNLRAPKYSDDTTLLTDAVALVRADIEGFVSGCKIEGLTLISVDAEDIRPMTASPKGADLGKMGIIDGKYGNGNWAWATISVVAVISLGEQETYVTLECALVSGQLKKPTTIDGAGYTQTAFRTAITKDIKVVETPAE